MTIDEQMEALNALDPLHGAAVRMREPGNWYCTVNADVVTDLCTLTRFTSRSPTPYDAVEALWKAYSTATVRLSSRSRVRWNGSEWEPAE